MRAAPRRGAGARKHLRELRRDDRGDTDHFLGFRGRPEVKERPETIPTALESVTLPEQLHAPVDVQALEAEAKSASLFLTRSGELIRFDLDAPAAAVLASLPEAVAPEPIPEPNLPPEVRDHDDWREWQSRTRAPRALHVSPDGRYAAVVSVHGSSGVVVDISMCWVADRTLAVTGIGHDDDHIIPGVRLFDVESGEERLAFAGPEGELFHDRRLFAAAPEGLVAWDPSTGERLGEVAAFTPSRHHRRAAELVELRGDHVVRWRIPAAG